MDKCQGKHFPIFPDVPLRLFAELAEEVRKNVSEPSENILFVGFAETATAVGAAVAKAFHGSRYIHTTREHLTNCEYAAEFSEEHSHATEQTLQCKSTAKLFDGVTRVIFVEDEITTGKTIVNFINALKANPKIPDNITYSACSILNGMSEERTSELALLGYDFYWLMKIDMSDYKDSLIPEPPKEIPKRRTSPSCEYLRIKGMLDPRSGVSANDYSEACDSLAEQLLRIISRKNIQLSGKKIAVIGTEECMYPAINAADKLREQGAEVYTHSTTRSPIEPHFKENYPLFSRIKLESFYDKNRTTYLYNSDKYDIVFAVTDSPKKDGFMQLTDAFSETDSFFFVSWETAMPCSYSPSDVTVLLKDITGLVEPLPAEERQRRIEQGAHYSEMLPLEYRPSEKYLKEYNDALERCAFETAEAVVSVCNRLCRAHPDGKIALVSLARAGTPVGILMKRCLKARFGINAAHYTISIIRGIGIDKNAMSYILAQHRPEEICFVDGWTGKGAILGTLTEALADYDGVSGSLAVLADPANITELCGTYKDILIPSSILNSTVSGLMSRTFLRSDIIGDEDFHGAAYHFDLEDEDLSIEYIEKIENAMRLAPVDLPLETRPEGTGIDEVKRIAADHDIDDINLVKPGLGEATRVLLRRVPYCLLIADNLEDESCVSHLLRLAEEKNVPVKRYPLTRYKACGIIRTLGGKSHGDV